MKGADKMAKIFIDSGHGDKDTGAIGNDLYEKDVVLDIALRIKKDLLIFKDVNKFYFTQYYISILVLFKFNYYTNLKFKYYIC